VGVSIALVAALGIGLAAGVQWHALIADMLGMHAHDQAAKAANIDANGHKQLWTCSMHPQVIKEEPGVCPICHMALTPIKEDAGASSMAAGDRKVKYWWDPMMSPPYISDKPGKSPMGMDLVPVYDDQISGGMGVTIDPVVVQNMGLRVAPVRVGTVAREIRAVGFLDEAQPNVRDVNLRVSGWVEKMYADTVGMALSKGAPLFDLYSPEVQVATEELIAARRSINSLEPGGDAAARKTSQGLFDATRAKLEQWGLDADQIDTLAKMDQPPQTVTFNSPIDGYLTQKMLVQGAAVKSGDTLLRIVDLSTVWLDSQVYSQDLPFVRLGANVTATVDGMPGKTFEGEVIFIQPELDPQTRTAIVRIALPNHELALRPGMYATARIHVTLTDRAVLVPREAVIDTGTRQIAFVSAGDGHFDPRQVSVGTESEDGMIQVLEGLAPGETVVTSGQFLLDSESRMREAIQKHLDRELLVKAPGTTRELATMPSPTVPSAMPTYVSATTAPAYEHPITHNSGKGWSPEIDRLFRAYLAIHKVLGASQAEDKPLDVSELVAAARAIPKASATSAQVTQLIDAAKAMQDKPLAEQRTLFKPLSEALIALARANPPSTAVAPKLYVDYCPMTYGDGAHWLQASDAIANPFFASHMKDCGSIEQILETFNRKGGGK